ncbi:hypothetical protein HYT00_01125 [Candidatus Giovannonibacteria bacterium]|nr:hypothetical protein [Candidatus Giovannonibacteria bacterium]
MNIKFLKFNISFSGWVKVLISDVRKLWNSFLWFLFLFSLVILAFDAYISFNYLGNGDINNASEENRILKKQDLRRAVERINEKKFRLENYVRELNIEDPSKFR